MKTTDLIFCMGEAANTEMMFERKADEFSSGKARRAYLQAMAAEWRAFNILQSAYQDKSKP